jgi:hypothetical protein
MSPLPADSHKSYLQLGLATTWDTPVAATIKLPLLEEDIELDADVIEEDVMWGNDNLRSLQQGSRFAKGSFTVLMNLDDCLEIMRGSVGAYANSLVETGVRDHFFRSGGALKFYSLEVVKGDVPAGKCWRVPTAKFVNIKIEGSNAPGIAGIVKARVTIIGSDIDDNFTPTGALTFPSNLPVKFDLNTVMDDGTADAASSIRVRNWSLELDQPHTDRDRVYGSLKIDEPARKSRLSAVWTFTQEFQTKTQMDALLACTSGSPRIQYQHPTTIGSTSKREFELRSGEAKLLSVSPPQPGPGVVICTSTWKASYDATDTCALLARFRNTQNALP